LQRAGGLSGLVPEFGERALYTQDIQKAGVSSFVPVKNGATELASWRKVEINSVAEGENESC
jgi:hypothetical protein